MSFHDRISGDVPRRAFEKGGSNNAAGNAGTVNAQNSSQAFSQIQQLIGQMNPQIQQTIAPFLSGQSNLGQGAPGLSSFFTGEMNNGGGAGFQQASTNAQNQLQQNFAQSLSSILGNLGPGQSAGAATTAAQNGLLTSSANLGSQLAGQQQQIEQQGATGLEGLLSGLDSTTLSALQPLLQMFSSSAGALGGIGTSSLNASTQDINLQNQENQQQNAGWESLFSGLVGGGAAAMTGGAAGAGGAGGILKAFSDARLKTNIEPVGPRVDGLQAYSFLWRHSGKPDVGFMAQDVERTHPEFVGETREGIKYVDYAAASDRFIRELERSLCAASAV